MNRILCILGTIGLISTSQAAPQAQEFTRYEGCKYLPEKWNDGDSFHVRMPDGKEQVLRLYFVDTPESDGSFPERIEEQAKYYSISPAASLQLGKEAAAFTQKLLSAQPFTVHTRWRVALGRSKLPRFYALVMIGERSLADLLVENGMARIYGTRTPLPDGRDSRAYLAQLASLEQKAKLAKVGGWNTVAFPRRAENPADAPVGDGG